MQVAIFGTGAVAEKHAEAYRNLGLHLAACTNRSPERGQAFARKFGCKFVPQLADLLADPAIRYLDVCSYPDTHLDIVRKCAAAGKPVLLEKPIAADLESAAIIAELSADLVIGVVSQKRYDDAALFLKRAVERGRLGKILQADAYVKWYRSHEYYSRPGKGAWAVEGGGALMNQAIHQLDILLHIIGPVSAVQANWQLGSAHSIESEDIVNALLDYSSGATGVIQAATAFWPGETERIEIHGTKGTAVLAGDKLVSWRVQSDDPHDPAPLQNGALSGASDPMAIPLIAFERQLAEFASAVSERRTPATSAKDGWRAVQLVSAVYRAAKTGARVQLST